MKGSWILASPSERRLLPGGIRGATPLMIAIMSFAMLIVAAAGLALANASGVVRQGLENRYTLQLAGSDRLGRALASVRAIPGVTAARPVPERDMRRTLERWLGPAASAADLPVPSLFHLDLAPGTDFRQLQKATAAAVPGSYLTGHQAALGPLLRSLRLLQWLCFALVALMATATATAVVLAARGALDTHRPTIEVMHGIGATDGQVARLFQRKIALDALAGSFGGAAAAGIVLLLVGGGAVAAELAGGPPLSPRDMLLLLLLPLLLVILATSVARMAVLAALRRAL